MECSICFERFFTPKTQDELNKLYEENVKNKDDLSEIFKFRNLLITSKNNQTHVCSTPNCGCLTCGDCWMKITHKGKGLMDLMNITSDDMPSMHDYFICPYCRIIDWKYYMNNVFQELQTKILGEEEFCTLLAKKWCHDDE